MAKKKAKSKSKKGTDDSGSKNKSGPSRIELVTAPSVSQAQAGRFGLGLVLSFPLGWGPLSDAFAGRGAYELSMAKFLLVVGASVTATTVIGNLLDKASKPKKQTDSAADTDPSDAADGQFVSTDTPSFGGPDRTDGGAIALSATGS